MQDFILELSKLLSFDQKLSLQLANNNPILAKELSSMMLVGLPIEQRLINDYFNNNLLLLREQIHKLHGGCCYTGFSKLKHIAKAIEQELINNPTTQSTLANYIDILNKEINYLINSK